jgi:hypothetical protein
LLLYGFSLKPFKPEFDKNGDSKSEPDVFSGVDTFFLFSAVLLATLLLGAALREALFFAAVLRAGLFLPAALRAAAFFGAALRAALLFGAAFLAAARLAGLAAGLDLLTVFFACAVFLAADFFTTLFTAFLVFTMDSPLYGTSSVFNVYENGSEWQ